MSTYTSEPGTRVAGRYRLEDQVSSGSGWALWKAIDETLARAVTVLMFAGGFPRIREAVTAARAASRLTDSRLSQVFDVDDSGEGAYIVMEWVAGPSLADMLADGPLIPARAVALVTEAAQALAVAHEAGLAHLRLGPGSLRWTPGGGVKITGLGIDAVLAGPDADGSARDDPAITDTRGLAGLLYAGLTGYWPAGTFRTEPAGPPGTEPAGTPETEPTGIPGAEPAGTPGTEPAGIPGTESAEPPEETGGTFPDTTALPPAPTRDGVPCSPRQVSAAVPVSIDSITCRALFQYQSRSGSTITSPAAFAGELARFAPPAGPVPPPAAAEAPPPAWRGAGAAVPPARAGSAGPPPPASAGRGAPRAARPAGPGSRDGSQARNKQTLAIVGAAAVLVLAAIGATAWATGHMTAGTTPGHSYQGGQQHPSSTANPVLIPVSAQGFDNSAAAKYAIDGNPSTYWHTDYYLGNPVFGGLKKGTGLLLDMGRQVRLAAVTVQFGPVCCGHVQIGIGNDDASPVSGGAFTVVTTSAHAAGTDTFSVNSTARGRYVLIWFTSLPPLGGSSGKYEAQIYNVVLRGAG